MAPNQNTTVNIRHETPNKNKRLPMGYDDGKSRQSALKSATGSNTRLASIPDKKLEEATQIYVDQE